MKNRFYIEIDGIDAGISSMKNSFFNKDLYGIWLDNPVSPESTISLQYSAPTANERKNVIQDIYGNDLNSLTTSSFSFDPKDITGPSLLDVELSSLGNTNSIELVFDEDVSFLGLLDLPDFSNFKSRVDGASVTLNGIGGSPIQNPERITLSFDTVVIDSGSSLDLEYSLTTGAFISDKSGNLSNPFLFTGFASANSASEAGGSGSSGGSSAPTTGSSSSGGGGSDVTPPVPQSLELSTTTVDLSGGAVTITATTRLTDDLSGIGNDDSLNAEIRWRSPSSNQFIDASFYAYANGDDNDATFNNAFPITFDANAEAGTWIIEYFRTADEAGNQKSYTADELTTLGFNISIDVTAGSGEGGGSDTTPPVPQSLELSTTTVDLSGGAVTITATTRLTDDLSGIGNDDSLNAEIRWRSPSGNQFIDASFYAYANGDDNDATFNNAFPITFDANAEAGTWTIEYFRTADEAGNKKSYTDDELTTLGINRPISVITGGNLFHPYDFNRDNKITLEHDAIIGLRMMFGTFPGDVLLDNSLTQESSGSSADLQAAMSEAVRDGRLDLDLDGSCSPLMDGLLLIEAIQQLQTFTPPRILV